MSIILIQKRLVEDAVSGFWDMFGTSVKSSRLESYMKAGRKRGCNSLIFQVENTGFEPVTSALQGRRSPI